MIKKLHIEFILLLIIFLLAFAVRIYKIDNPVADWHSWRQADTSAVSRNFLKYGFNPLHPRFDDLSNIPSGKENPSGYRMVEFPVYNILQAKLAQVFPQKTLEWWGRMISILFSLGSMAFLYLLTLKYLGGSTALLTIFFFAFLPYSVFYSRVILPEPMMIFTSLGMIYFFDKWVEKESSLILYLSSLIFAWLSLLLKPYTGFLFLPLAYLALNKWGTSSFKKLSLYFYFLFSLIPFLLWRLWISQYPEGIPAFTWLLNEGDIRFKGAFFRWLFAERLGKLILGYWGLILFTVGILVKGGNKKSWFFHWWLLAILIYFTVFAGGNVRHDYYQVMAIPVICVFLAKGSSFLLFEAGQLFNRPLSYLLLAVCCLFLIAFSWYEVRGYYNINHPEIVEAGKVADRLLPQNSKVIAPYNGDTAFLYQVNRQGWPVVTDSVDYLISKGATAYVSVNLQDEVTKSVVKKYKTLISEKNYVIVDLSMKR